MIKLKKDYVWKLVSLILAGIIVGYILFITENLFIYLKSNHQKLLDVRHFNCHYEIKDNEKYQRYETHLNTNKYLIIETIEEITILKYPKIESYNLAKEYFKDLNLAEAHYEYNNEEKEIKIRQIYNLDTSEEKQLWYKDYKERLDAKYMCEEI